MTSLKSMESLNELSSPQWEKTIILSITTHGGIIQESPEDIRVFTVPEGITIKRALISTPGECNLLYSQEARMYLNFISNNKKKLTSDIESIQNETIQKIVDFIKKDSLKGSILYAKEKEKELEQTSKKMKLNTEDEEILNTYTRFLNNINKGFNIIFFNSGTQILNKLYTRYNIEKTKNDWSIQVMNMRGMPDLLSFIRIQTRRGESVITLEEIINFLNQKGVENIIIFDFSCSNLMNEEQYEIEDQREIRQKRRDIIKMNYGGKKTGKTKSVKKQLKNKYKTLKNKRIIKRKNKIIKNRRGGNKTEQIDLRQILITKPIINAIKQYVPDIDLSEFKISKGEQGFRLNRMDQMMESNFDELLENEPVELKVARTPDGKMIGAKIDGVMKKMYEIINGRHRITRSIIEGNKSIKAIIV